MRISSDKKLFGLIQRLGRYREEVRLCALLGADNRNRLRLIRDTLLFHLRNGLKRNDGNGRARTYRINFAGREHHLHMRRHSGDFFVFHEVLLGECYHLPLAWRQNVQTIVDLGANIGLTSLYLSSYAPAAQCICVEPDPQNAALLHHNLAGLSRPAIVIEGAVSAQAGYVQMDADQPSWGGRVRHQGTGTVRAYTIAQILACSDKPIDILKIDIEGSETELFQGDWAWLKQVRLIIIELHDAAATQAFTTAMARAGFTVIPQDSPFGNRMVCAVHPSLAPR